MSELTTVSISMFLRCEADSCGASHHLGAVVDRFTCRRCLRLEPLSAERWRDLLDAAVHDLPRMRAGTELTFDLERASGYVEASRASAACAICKTPLPIDAVERGRSEGHCACAKCGSKLLVRAVPASLAAALPGITHLLGEDIGSIANPDPPAVLPGQELTATCPSCGGGLPIDGSSQAVQCTYCRNMVVLPDAIWRDLRPGSTEPHTFYLVHDAAAPRSRLRADLHWSSLRSVTGDSEGNLYGVAEDADVCAGGDEDVVFALDPQGHTRWLRRDLKKLHGAEIAWRADGMLLVWSSDRSTATLLRSADGGDAGKLGAEQQPKSDAHTLDLAHAQALCVDTDGSVIFVKESRIVRCAPDGTATPIWPARKGFLGWTRVAKTSPFTGESIDDAPRLEELDEYPTSVRGGKVCVGWDGALYVWESRHLVSFDRAGKKRFAATLPAPASAVGVDASGTVYVAGRADDGTSLFRVAPNGSVACLVDASESDVVLPRRGIVVRPDGTMVLFGEDRRMVALGSDGSILWQSKGEVEPDDDDDDD